ncbi:MAG: DUF1501 domain-containing protein [Planctomycetaceae bacterium]|nr:DUF1501 domain-containing protein [Planctomycetaceae bacterium]
MQPNRRQMIQSLAGSGLLLPGLLSEMLQGAPANTVEDPLAPRQPHFPAKVKRVIFLFMTGAVSQVDTFDPKPYLDKHHNQSNGKRRFYKGSDWKFRPYGKSGIEVSDLFPNVGSVIDDICMIRSMQNINGDHFGATIGIHTGSATFNRPSIGSWVSYGLGTENQNLPSFMVISPGLPYAGGQVWGSDFLPVLHQGTRIIPGKEPIANMSRRSFSRQQQETELDLLSFFNRQYQEGREQDPNLAGRIKSFETAFGMQMAAPEAFDLSGESAETHALYGLDPGSTEGFGWQCLVARRLAERGVRFIELIDGDTNIDSNWDAHAKMGTYNKLARNVDQPIAALLKDLKRRGMLDETLVVWTTEFGRGVFTPAPGAEGRGHHSRNYCSWLAGGGIRGGMVYGSSDELGDAVAENAVSVHDFQATILQQLGIDHERLTYRHAGRDYRLTDVHGRVVKEILK